MGAFADRFRTGTHFDWLTREARDRIHTAALDVLETTGMRFHSPTARRELAKAGAKVDDTSRVVRLPKDLVEDLLGKAPKRITLAGRTPEFDLPMDGTHAYFTTDGCGVAVWDPVKGARRESVLEDVRRTAVLGDYLPYVSIYEPMVVAHDVPESAHVAAGVQAAMENTQKHILSESTTKPAEAKAQVAMAEAVLGSAEELRKRHYLSAMLCTTSPLSVDANATDAALIWAEHGVPVHITSMAQAGVSGPVTYAGDLVVCHAETLAVVSALEAHAPGAPAIYGSVLSGMDPRTGAYMGGSPESTLLAVGSIEMAKHVRLPCSVGGFGSSSKLPGVQATMENTLITTLCAQASGEVINGIGTPAGSTLLSYEQLLVDHEIAAHVVVSCGGIRVDDESLALDLIKKVGVGGTFLAQRHTLAHLREIYQPMLWDTEPYEVWMKKGGKDAMAVAHEAVDRILREHRPEPLGRSVRERLAEIVRASAQGQG